MDSRPPSQTPLFDLGPVRPTTRDIAKLVKAGGIEALPDATRLADEATYQEIRCRSALNRVHGMPFIKWTLNPYRGCTHGCHYCFARRYQSQLELGAGDEFASVIFVKVNFVDVLKRELDRPSWTHERVSLGTATDPYQPIEGRYRLTRGCLEALALHSNPASIVTKGPMVVRDRDVIQEVAWRSSCSVYLSVPTVDEDAWKSLEPGTAHPLQRLRAVKTLVDAGIEAGVLMAPLVPGISTHPSKIERTIKAIADHGARFVGAMVLHLEGGTRDHFMRYLSQAYPSLAHSYETLYAAKYAPKDYVERVQEVVGVIRARHGMMPRERRERGPEGEEHTREAPAMPSDTAGAPPEQGVLRWSGRRK